MQDNIWPSKAGLRVSTKSEISDTIKKEKQSATRALHDAQDAVARKASESHLKPRTRSSNMQKGPNKT